MAMNTITLGGGCFWCLEAPIKQLKGVASVISGYAGGPDVENAPTYQQICTGTTGYAEVIHIQYDANILPFSTLLAVFFALHDPTTLNRQGADQGSQYRSIILYHDDNQFKLAQTLIRDLEKSHQWSDPIVTELKAFDIFYQAEDYHQNYFQLNPNNRYCQAVISPKLTKLKQTYSSLLNE
jgi:peptide-methionine (S)-S-oxide reductase